MEKWYWLFLYDFLREKEGALIKFWGPEEGGRLLGALIRGITVPIYQEYKTTMWSKIIFLCIVRNISHIFSKFQNSAKILQKCVLILSK